MGAVRNEVYDQLAALTLEPTLYGLAQDLSPDFGHPHAPTMHISHAAGSLVFGEGRSVFQASWRPPREGEEVEAARTRYSLLHTSVPYQVGYAAVQRLVAPAKKAYSLKGAVFATVQEEFTVVPHDRRLDVRRRVTLGTQDRQGRQKPFYQMRLSRMEGSHSRPLPDDCQLCSTVSDILAHKEPVDNCEHESPQAFWDKRQIEWDVNRITHIVGLIRNDY